MTLQADFKAASECYIYTLSRDMLRVKRESNPKLSLVQIEMVKDGGGTQDTIVKTYYTDANGALEIPLRNQVNAYHDEGVTKFMLAVIVKDLDGTPLDPYIYMDCYVREGVSLYDRRVPQSPYPLQSLPINSPFMEILPPSVMFIQHYIGVGAADELLSGIIVESTYANDHGDGWSWGNSGTYHAITPSGERGTQIIVNSFADVLRFDNGKDAKYEWQLKPLTYANCQDAVVIRWTSLTGAVRQHWFPVVGYVNDTDKQVSMLSAGDGYKVRKNATTALKCRLTGLTAYDCWYYQDMLQSSDVHVICRSEWLNMPPFLTAIRSTLTACHVEGGMPQTPDGNGFFTFEFTVKMKHYDTI